MTCAVCGASLAHKRKGAMTCSDPCRKKRSRERRIVAGIPAAGPVRVSGKDGKLVRVDPPYTLPEASAVIRRGRNHDNERRTARDPDLRARIKRLAAEDSRDRRRDIRRQSDTLYFMSAESGALSRNLREQNERTDRLAELDDRRRAKQAAREARWMAEVHKEAARLFQEFSGAMGL